MQRLFGVALIGSLLAACGDGGSNPPGPTPGTVERPLPDAQRPATDDQRPVANDQRPPPNDQAPLPPSDSPNLGAGGRSTEVPGNGGRGNQGPGNSCRRQNACIGCDDCRDRCECLELSDAVCDAECDSNG